MPNVSISKFTEFRGKSFLLIDDLSEFRSAVRQMVQAFGATKIDTSSNGEDAVDKIKRKHYSIILCDYTLGEGKNGQQVLEEIKELGILDDSQIFIMLTAESTAQLVMGALECEPDGYLVKPFNKEMLYQRLVRIIHKKAVFDEIYKDLKGKPKSQIIEICDRYIYDWHGSILPILKIKGKFYLEFNQYEEAAKLYTDLLQSHNLPWIYAGAGKAYYYLNDYEKSREYFEHILNENSTNVDVFDWMAKIEIAEGNAFEAQNILLRATDLSPSSVKRQQSLGDIAYKNGDLDIASSAYKQACRLGKHSVFRRAKDFLNFAEIKLQCANEDDVGREKVSMAKEAIAMLDIMSFLFAKDLESMFTCNAKKARAYLLIGKKDKARMACRQTIEMIVKYKLISNCEENERFIDLLLELECDREIKTLTGKFPDTFEVPKEDSDDNKK